MIRTVSHSIKKDNGTATNIIIEPVLTQSASNGLDFTGVYTLYKDTDAHEYHLLDIQEIAPEIGDSLPLVDDKKNPDFLGRIVIKGDNSNWEYTGGTLTPDEQSQLISYIQSADR
ncbi:hypothetical protein SAMN05216464_101131 [Mucilaginibacter pineti]|uniref:Uncharacterized protein n=1 Tax=Mucilaginibacter pineti TaxID=1391627 RepID=A0A1G6T2E7_9SPHI|nr:hypothetical protein [Mucilaginibacter pineti]SDD22657.1 hypothetical protein SAMN05216464_101131 [Mucilaginibacter pineti]